MDSLNGSCRNRKNNFDAHQSCQTLENQARLAASAEKGVSRYVDCLLSSWLTSQCDLNPSGCSRCAKIGKICPGYRHEQDRVFQVADASTFVTKQTQSIKSKSLEKTVRVITKDSASTQTSLHPIFFREPSITNARYVALVLNLFSTDTDGGKSYGLLESLPELVGSATEESCLNLAIRALAKAYASNQRDNLRSNVNNHAVEAYGKALKATNLALKDPILRLQDSTLVSVWLLSVHEVSHSLTYMSNDHSRYWLDR
jgi:hypothetical protein